MPVKSGRLDESRLSKSLTNSLWRDDDDDGTELSDVEGSAVLLNVKVINFIIPYQ